MDDLVADRSHKRPKTVLIVAENDPGMDSFCRLLAGLGYEALRTIDGMEGLKLTRQQHPDLVVVGAQLSLISGLDLAKWLKEDEELCAIPVVVTFAAPEERTRQAAYGI